MELTGIKRKREPNFTAKEEIILIICVKKHIKIVENKTTDAINNAEKLRGWEKIYKDFNQNNDRHRSVKALKEKYENLKKRAKKVFAEEKIYNKGTGGGPYKDFGITDVDLQLKEILGKRLEGNSEENSNTEIQTSCNVVDYEFEKELDANENEEFVQFTAWDHNYDQPSTSTANENLLQPSTSTANVNVPRGPISRMFLEDKTNSKDECNEGKHSRETEVETVSKEQSYFKKMNVNSIRTPVSINLKRTPISSNVPRTATGNRFRQTDPLKTKLGDWANSKSELVDLQKKHIQEEHDIKIKHLEKKIV
ncbi:unnamed protein product [Psylliodes chrysocephalus]|uniref:Regulatory protein zeste n=1 Tax=Psylliodes chrysocephalus TaxID=3402493 RepID=A0A9P0CJB8_9CUCU|nr:unnamed protein product [Psylliodes chrysocephala]